MKVIATVLAVDLGVHLVGTDVLGDATGLLVDHVGLAERVEELGLAVVDVTHDGHDRRTDDEVGLVALVLAELEVERLEQLAVLVLGRDDLDDVVELLAEQLERLVVDRLGRGDHLAEAEQHLHQRGGVDADLLGEVGQRGAARQAHGLAVALADAHATDRRGLHLPRTPGDAPASTCDHDATGRRDDRRHPGCCHGRRPATGTATAAGTTATGATAQPGPPPGPAAEATATGSAAAGRRAATATGTTTTAGATGATADRRGHRGHRRGRHRRRPGTWASSPGWGAACRDGHRRGRPAGRGARWSPSAPGARGRTAGTGRRTAAHALGGRERVVARARSTGTAGAAGTSDRTRPGGAGRVGRGRLLVSGGRCLGGRCTGCRLPAAAAGASWAAGRGPGRGPGAGPRLLGSLGDRRGGLDRGCRRSLGGRCRRRSGAWGASVAAAAGAWACGAGLAGAFLAAFFAAACLHLGAQLGPVLVLELLDDGGLDRTRVPSRTPRGRSASR